MTSVPLLMKKTILFSAYHLPLMENLCFLMCVNQITSGIEDEYVSERTQLKLAVRLGRIT